MLYARCLRQFEKATRNTLLWRVPGQRDASKGRNNRMTEMIDFFPTVIDLVGVPKIPQCTGVDQPPTVLCLQGESYADEFLTTTAATATFGVGYTAKSTPKQYAFSQWPSPARQGNGRDFRMGYTVRSIDGFRLTQYVPYNRQEYSGNWLWPISRDDLELYDYNTDPDERINQAANPKYTATVQKMLAVLKAQYSNTDHR